MSKEEIQNKIDSISADRDALERTRNKLSGDIALLLKQIAEAEKPKLRHGDFGLWVNEKDWFVVDDSGDDRIYIHLLWAGKHDKRNQWRYDNKFLAKATIFGNIFDLLKEWSEDLEYFEFDVHHCEINTVEFPHAPIHIAGNWHTLAEAEEIWHKLGRVIATLKKKNPQQ